MTDIAHLPGFAAWFFLQGFGMVFLLNGLEGGVRKLDRYPWPRRPIQRGRSGSCSIAAIHDRVCI